MIKKILIIPSWYPNKDNPVLGTFMREQALLLKNDFDIRVLAGHTKKQINRWEKLKNTWRYFLGNRTNDKQKNDFFLSPPDVYGFEYSRGLNYFKKSNFQMTISAFLHHFEKMSASWMPDIIHAHDTFWGGIIAHKISEKWKIPYIITEHNNLMQHYQSFIETDYVNAIRQAKIMLLVSESQLRTLRIRNLQNEVQVVGNYVDEEKYKISKPNKNNTFNILFVGSHTFLKDYKTLISTIIECSHKIKKGNYNFTIVGCGENGKKELEKTLSEYGLQPKLACHPFVNRHEMPTFYQACDVLLSTSISETFGVAACEAMMCGKPVVSTNNGGFDEMYIPKINGIKCAIGDAKGLSNALLSIYNNESIFNPEEIRKSVLNKFGTIAFKKKMIKAYA